MSQAPVRTGRWTRLLLDSHSLIGVVFGALVYLICLSGALAVVADEFELWERPDAPAVTRVDPALIGRTAQNAIVAARETGVTKFLFVTFATADLPRTTVVALDGKGAEREWNADATGRLVPRATAAWTSFVREHHESLNLPAPFGGWVVGLIGTALLASLFSGILAHRRIIKDAFRLRWGGSRRLANADLHNRIGVWALPFHVIVALTGSLLGLAGLIILVLAAVAFKGDSERAIAAVSGPPVIADARPAPLPDVASIARAVERAAPGARIEALGLENTGTRGQRVRMFVGAPGHLSRADVWNYDGQGRPLGKLGLADGPVGMRIYGMLTPLHYGTYGGVPLKLVYLVLGLGMAALVATGTQILLARRREQGRSALRWERVWDAVVWGQPLALVLAALAAITLGLPPLVVYWAATLALVAGAGLARTLSRALVQAVTGASMLSLAVLQLGAHGLPSAVFAGVEFMLALTGAAMLRLVIRPSAPARGQAAQSAG